MRYFALRFQVALLGIGAVLAVIGGQKVFVWAKNTSPTEMKYADFCHQNVDAEWLILDECYLDYRFSCAIDQVEEDTKRVKSTEYYVAVFSNQDGEDDIKAFLVVDDPAKQRLMKEFWKIPEDQEDAWFERNKQRCIEENVQVRGLARSGLDLDSEDQRLLKKVAPSANPDFRIIESGEQPDGILGIIIAVLGLAMFGGGGFWLFTSVRSKKRKQLPYPPAGSYAPGPYGPGAHMPPAAQPPQMPPQPGVVPPPPHGQATEPAPRPPYPGNTPPAGPAGPKLPRPRPRRPDK